jgi:hypothetical protein
MPYDPNEDYTRGKLSDAQRVHRYGANRVWMEDRAPVPFLALMMLLCLIGIIFSS